MVYDAWPNAQRQTGQCLSHVALQERHLLLMAMVGNEKRWQAAPGLATQKHRVRPAPYTLRELLLGACQHWV